MKVSINLRIRTADRKQPYCPVVWEGKRIKKLKPGWCVVQGVEQFHPEGVYHPRVMMLTLAAIFLSYVIPLVAACFGQVG